MKLEKALCPVLVVMAQEDDLILPDLSRRLASKASESIEILSSIALLLILCNIEVQLVEAPGGHFDIMPGGKACSASTLVNNRLIFFRDSISISMLNYNF